MQYCKECGKTEDQVGKWTIAEELPRYEKLDKFIKEQVDEKIMEMYRQQLSLYSKEEKSKFDNTVLKILNNKKYSEEIRQAISYFYLKLHVLENDFIK